jgi:hypothetical protein
LAPTTLLIATAAPPSRKITPERTLTQRGSSCARSGPKLMTPEATTAKKTPMAAVMSPSTMFSFFWLAHLRVHKRPLKAAIRLRAGG